MLRIYFFGGLSLSWNDSSLPAIPGLRARSLLAYLAMQRDRAHTRDLLAGTFWPDLTDAVARRRLSQALWQINRVLKPLSSPAPFLLTTADTVRFNSEAPCWVDVEAFRAYLRMPQASLERQALAGQIAAAELGELQAAVALYKGDFLVGFYDDWILIERERLRDLFLIALSRLLELSKTAGAYEDALAYARRLVAEDPLHEKGHREVMRLFHRLGRSQEALRHYELCRATLAEELGIEPAAATRSLTREIALSAGLAEEPYLPSSGGPRHAAPLEGQGATPLVGRRLERAALLSYLEQAMDGRGELVLMEGEAGVGKSRLLQEVVRDARWRGVQVLQGYGHEQAALPAFGLLGQALAAALSPLRAGQLAQLLKADWLSQASLVVPELAGWLPDLPPRVSLGPEQDRLRLLEALARILLALGQIGPHLLILEDLHWADAATLDALIHLAQRLAEPRRGEAASRLLVIASFRSGEARSRPAVWQALLKLDRSGCCQRLELARLTAEETGELVRRWLGSSQGAPRFEARLYQETEGNPLFVLETLRGLHDEGLLYRDASGLWATPWDETTIDYAELPLPAGVRQVIARRLAQLGPDERTLLNAAAVLGAAFDLSLLLQTSDLARETCLAAAGKLVERRFLLEEPAAYRFSHDNVRQAAYHEMTESERRRLHGRAGQALEKLDPAQVEALAHHFGAAEAWDKAMAYSRQAGDRARAVYAGAEALAYYEGALRAWRRLDAPDPAFGVSLHQAAGEIGQENGRFDQAQADFQAAHELAAQSGDRPAQARALNGLSYLAFQRGDYAQSARLARQALDHSRMADSARQRASALLNQANALRNLGDPAAAIELYGQAAAFFEELDDQARLADCLCRWGYAYIFRGRYPEAQSVIERSLAIRRQLNDRVGISYSLSNLTALYHFQGQFERAREAAQEAFQVASAIDDPYGQDAALFNQALLLLEQGDPAAALPLFEQALAIGRRIGDRPLEAEALAEMGRSYYLLGDLAQAHALLEQALAAMAAGGECWHRPKTHAYLAQVLLALGQGKQALVQAELGLCVAQEIQDLWSLGLTQRLLGEVAARPGGDRCAIQPAEHFEESVRILRAIGAQAELARSLAAYGLYLACAGDAGEVVTAQPAEQARRSSSLRIEISELAQPAVQLCESLIAEARALFQQMNMAGDLRQLEQRAGAILAPGQVRVRLPAASAPTGRPLRDDEWVEVAWIAVAGDDEAVMDKTLRRQQQLLRLLQQAADQGAAPTVDDLAAALAVSRATIKRDLASLRQAGQEVRTRGSRS